MTAPDSRDSCKHFWSQPDTAGMIQCLWCQKVAPAPGQYVTDNTLARGPQQAGGEDVGAAVERLRKNARNAFNASSDADTVIAAFGALQAEVARLRKGIVHRGDNVVVPLHLYDEINATGAAWKQRAETAEAALREARTHVTGYVGLAKITGYDSLIPLLRDFLNRSAALNGGQDDA